MSTPEKLFDTPIPIHTATPSFNDLNVESKVTRVPSSVISRFHPSQMNNGNSIKENAFNSDKPSNGCFR